MIKESQAETLSVEKAIKRFHQRVAEHKVDRAFRDDDLAESVRRVVEERDTLFHVATEMLATILLERNRKIVPAELRQIADAGWRPQIEAIGAGRELAPGELNLALETSGIDIEKGYARVREAIEKFKHQHKKQ